MTITTTERLDAVFADAPLMAILRGTGVERSIALATTAWDLGIDSVEVTLQSADDLTALREVARLGADRGKTVGAGTILHPSQVEAARAAGAGYLVSPDSTRAWSRPPRRWICRCSPASPRRRRCSSRSRSASPG